ncbi:hypothetical protein DFR50_109136 [Roseiarcus fermentans]|uniref:Uncharacterized protein n=1 Tax=Roseiarcus fermentans TaxID=1473586 RepID=A0A366FIA0_9HYPH|nr:hypothetical protein DFR50_109136 [Roseiarcus fermentans]
MARHRRPLANAQAREGARSGVDRVRRRHGVLAPVESRPCDGGIAAGSLV